MNIILVYPLLFVIGSLFGWFIEAVHRFWINKKYTNPGFLLGPYVPIYGIGLIILYLISLINLSFVSSEIIRIIILIIVSTVLVTLLEYITGYMFLKTLKLRLWDYSDRKGNVQGLICPLYIFYWVLISGVYYLVINDFIIKIILFVNANRQLLFVVGIVIGIMAIDFLYSSDIMFKITNWANTNNEIVKYYKIRKVSNKDSLNKQLSEYVWK